LSWRAKDVGSSLPIIDLARANNDSAPDMIAGRVAVELAKKNGTAVKGAKILIVGVAYKKDVEDTRESPALAILTRLEEMGAACDYHDPYFPVFPLTRDHPALAGRRSVELSEATLADFDAVVVATDHRNVDYGIIAKSAKLVLDTRNVFSALKVGVPGGKLVKI
ncbi:MAG: hypothetical protein OEY05_04500, partial [Paracoccaceae bacterium]|nr:hypothetical protein [Paracoccaceae bacterium]